MTKEEAITYLEDAKHNLPYKFEQAIDMAIEALSTEATKKKAELKENGDWDCPDVGCDECDHHRNVSWCSLAIPNHEEIDDTYKMVNEAFFKGFYAAEEQYRLLIEEVEELEKKSADADVVRCKDCRYQEHCYETVAHTKGHDGFREHWSEPIEWCSRGERREE